MKKCNACDLEKGVSCFSPLKSGRGGLNPVCKECRAESVRVARLANPELYRKAEAARHLANPSIKKSSIKRYYSANKDALIEKAAQRYAVKADEIKAQKKEYRAANKDKIRCLNGTRRATQRMATPVWVDKKAIADVYKLASQMWLESGEPHHVDHIIPLNNKYVCGLHVPCNLQVLRGVDNMKKSNRFEIAN